MQNGDMLIFFLRSFRKVRFRKMQFLKDGVHTVDNIQNKQRKEKFMKFSQTMSAA